MKDFNPHPLVEDHYHIRELIEAQQKRADERTKYQNEKKNQEGFSKYVNGFKQIELLDFFCTHCGRDFIARAKKQVDSWGELAYYKTKHRCGTWCIRHVTDKHRDSYFYRSKRVAYDRANNINEMLQPFQSGFNTLYGKK